MGEKSTNTSSKKADVTKAKKTEAKQEKVAGDVVIEEKAKKQLEAQVKKTGKKKSSKLSKILMVVLVIVVVIAVIFAVAITNKTQNKSKLNEEIENLFSMDLDSSDFEGYEIVTTGDYAIVEETIKEYYKEFANAQKELNTLIDDEEIQTMLTAENLEEDGPEFESSLEYISTSQEKLAQVVETLKNLFTYEEIMSRIESQNLSDYYVKLYKSYFFEDTDTAEDLTERIEDLEETETLMNNLYNNETKILNFLKENAGHWEISNSKLSFDSSSLSAQYNTLKTQLFAE